MIRRIRIPAIVLAMAVAATAAAEPKLLLMEPEIDGDTGPGGEAGFRERLDLLGDTIAGAISDRALYEVVDSAAAEASLEKHRRRADVFSCTPCVVESADEAGAERVLSVSVFRMSALISSMRAVLRDAGTGEVRYSTAQDFRGDTVDAWLRAADRLVRDMERDVPAASR